MDFEAWTWMQYFRGGRFRDLRIVCRWVSEEKPVDREKQPRF